MELLWIICCPINELEITVQIAYFVEAFLFCNWITFEFT